jgi:hypothetical protein
MIGLRRAAFIAAFAALAVGLVGTSIALGSRGDALSNSRPNALATGAVTEQQSIRADHAIGAAARARYAIPNSAVADPRPIGTTSQGVLYLVPGDTGVCLLLAEASACGELNSPVSLFVPASDGSAVGGGVVAASVDELTLVQGSTQIQPIVRSGVFIVSEADGLRADRDELIGVNVK